MLILNCIYNIFKSVSLLAVVLTLAFSVPMSAHTNIVDHGAMDHHEMSHDHSDYTHDMSVMDMTSSDITNDIHEHNGAGCCETGLCISAALVDNLNITDTVRIHIHIALPNSKMTSVGKPRLMRPPNL